jgi:hypothetical protein
MTERVLRHSIDLDKSATEPAQARPVPSLKARMAKSTVLWSKDIAAPKLSGKTIDSAQIKVETFPNTHSFQEKRLGARSGEYVGCGANWTGIDAIFSMTAFDL